MPLGVILLSLSNLCFRNYDFSTSSSPSNTFPFFGVVLVETVGTTLFLPENVTPKFALAKFDPLFDPRFDPRALNGRANES